MDALTKKNCTMEEGTTYSHGLKHCEDGKCMVCNDGRWEEPAEAFPPKKGLTIAPGRDLSDI